MYLKILNFFPVLQTNNYKPHTPPPFDFGLIRSDNFEKYLQRPEYAKNKSKAIADLF